MQKLNVDFSNDNKTLVTYLSSKYPKVNVNTFYKTLRKKDIKINGKRINKNVNIHYGDEIQIYLTDDILNGIDINMQIPIVYEDDNILIINKPKDIEVEGENAVTSILSKNYNYLKPCHRIDRNTTGLVIFAKNDESLNEIIKMFENFEIEKHYVACCYGIPKSNATLYAYLFKESKKSIVYISKEPKKGYSKIQTSYTLISQNQAKNLSLLDVTLHTGKTHQIRAHLAFAGLPILGDGKYGSYEINKKFKVYTQCLCSYSIKFNLKNNYDKLNYLKGNEIKLKKMPYTDLIENNTKNL